MKGTYNQDEPAIWLGHEKELNRAHQEASFVEYLRWMRAPLSDTFSDEEIDRINNETKKKIFKKALDKASNYSQYYKQRNQKTKQIAGEDNTFTVSCAWRVRVGGMRGPEQMLLPAFDAMGMPYIPSSTLRGVARSQGVKEFYEQKIKQLKQNQEQITAAQRKKAQKEAEAEIATYFGSLDAKEENRAGKVIFLDAYQRNIKY